MTDVTHRQLRRPPDRCQGGARPGGPLADDEPAIESPHLPQGV